ncbi:hypothetical protein WDU94_003650 [Cyamophila willieti]
MFPGRWIGRGGIARCPDFNPLDFFFWGLMRSLVYKTTIEPPPKDLVGRIFAAAGEIAEDQAMIRKTTKLDKAKTTGAEGGKSSSKLNIVDNKIIDIIGRDTAVIDGLPILETPKAIPGIFLDLQKLEEPFLEILLELQKLQEPFQETQRM